MNGLKRDTKLTSGSTETERHKDVETCRWRWNGTPGPAPAGTITHTHTLTHSCVDIIKTSSEENPVKHLWWSPVSFNKSPDDPHWSSGSAFILFNKSISVALVDRPSGRLVPGPVDFCAGRFALTASGADGGPDEHVRRLGISRPRWITT